MPITIKGLLIQNFLSTLHQKGIEDHTCCCHCFCSSFSSLPTTLYFLTVSLSVLLKIMNIWASVKYAKCSFAPAVRLLAN